jgi:D-3-phosphoglycerate dehydrogenase / 2-oxoglutarate reductase
MTVLLLETIHQDAFDFLVSNGHIIKEAYDEFTLSQIDKSKVDIIITRGKGLVRQPLIDECFQLKAIARCGIGLENIDVDYAKSKGISIYNAPGSNTQTTAEHTFVLMSSLVRGIYHPLFATKNYDFQYRNSYQGDELFGKELGIIGLGNIGNTFGKMASSFGCNVSYFSRSKKDTPFAYKELDSLIEKSDIISLNAPLTIETEGLVNESFLSKMKNGAYLINTARTEMIDIPSVLDSLENGQLRGYASDCPMRIDTPEWRALIAHPNALISPHIASLTKTTYREMCMITVRKI